MTNKRLRHKILHLESLVHSQAPKDQQLQWVESSGKENLIHEGDNQSRQVESSLDFVYEVTENTHGGMKWDHVQEHLSIAKMKLPHTTAFEIGILDKNSNLINIEGYSHEHEKFYSREVNWNKSRSIYTDVIKSQKIQSRKIAEASPGELMKFTGTFEKLLAIPLILDDNRYAVICLYGTSLLDDEHLKKAVKSEANYLELMDR